MADINLTQVIHNVKEAYVGLTGDTDEITYGNISTKISEIETGGGEQVIDTKTICVVTKLQSVVLAIPTNTTITIQ